MKLYPLLEDISTLPDSVISVFSKTMVKESLALGLENTITLTSLIKIVNMTGFNLYDVKEVTSSLVNEKGWIIGTAQAQLKRHGHFLMKNEQGDHVLCINTHVLCGTFNVILDTETMRQKISDCEKGFFGKFFSRFFTSK